MSGQPSPYLRWAIPPDRRTVLKGAALAGVAGLGVTACSTDSKLGHAETPTPTAPVDLGAADAVPVGGASSTASSVLSSAARPRGSTRRSARSAHTRAVSWTRSRAPRATAPATAAASTSRPARRSRVRRPCRCPRSRSGRRPASWSPALTRSPGSASQCGGVSPSPSRSRGFRAVRRAPPYGPYGAGR